MMDRGERFAIIDGTGCTLIRLSDERSVYFQPGDDAGEFINECYATLHAILHGGITYTNSVADAIGDTYPDDAFR